MRVRGPIVATFLSVGIAYAGYPYWTLYRLGSAIRSADSATLESLVDWPAVREGIKEDICDQAADDPGAPEGQALPAFGTSFMRGIASTSIDRAVTPEAFVAAASPQAGYRSASGADMSVSWAFFESPTTFLVDLKPPGSTDPVALEMGLRHGQWQVQRVWLPPDMLSPGSKT